MLQGVGAALLTPGSLAILQHTFAPGDRARAIGSWSGLTGVAGAIGPFVGGWLIAVGDWRWAFLVNLPLALLVVVVPRRHVPDIPPARRAGHLDWPGALWLAASLGLVSYALTAWASYGLTDLRVLGALGLGVLTAGGTRLRDLIDEQVGSLALARPRLELAGVAEHPVLAGALQTALAATRNDVFDTIQPKRRHSPGRPVTQQSSRREP